MSINTSILSSIRISGTGLSAQRTRMNVISKNIANAETTRTPEGGPYKRLMVVLSDKNDTEKNICKNCAESENETGKLTEIKLKEDNPNHLAVDEIEKDKKRELDGVKVVDIVADNTTPFRTVYDPSHPDADKDGYVTYPNVNIIQEMVDMISATRAYEANVTIMKNSKQMFMKALDIVKV